MKKFTLVELLVVIAIISILAALLMPTLSTALDNAKQAQCTSNLRQSTLALLLYANDFDEMVLQENVPAGSSTQSPWTLVIVDKMEYFSKARFSQYNYFYVPILVCPLAPYPFPPTMDYPSQGNASFYAYSQPLYRFAQKTNIGGNSVLSKKYLGTAEKNACVNVKNVTLSSAAPILMCGTENNGVLGTALADIEYNIGANPWVHWTAGRTGLGLKHNGQGLSSMLDCSVITKTAQEWRNSSVRVRRFITADGDLVYMP